MALKKKPSRPPDGSAQAATVNRAVGRAVRELRELKRLSARDLAQKAGVSPAMVSRIESGQVSPSLEPDLHPC